MTVIRKSCKIMKRQERYVISKGSFYNTARLEPFVPKVKSGLLALLP